MKKIFCITILTFFLFYILGFPEESVQAAAFGLNLWYEKMLPTLLPFSILSYILIHSGLLDNFAQKAHRFLKHLFPISSAGIYPLTAGLLFGFPLGSKITADLVLSGKMSREEGQRLFCACNNISPMFIGSFLLNETLQRPELRLATYLILYVPPLALYMIWNRNRRFRSSADKSKKTASMNFQLIDAGIMNGFETLAKLGGYIVMFAILAQMTTLIPVSSPVLKCLMIGFTEITNGISYTAGQNLDFSLAYPLMMAYTAFGGLSGFAQTASMVKDTGFSMIPYLLIKLLATALSFGLALLLVHTL
ncbi:MAG: hypothetical protein HFI69_01675 [Lachnospiraceae bacterium]|nr:hypothetical protein [Lachnospiraceae bacterium]